MLTRFTEEVARFVLDALDGVAGKVVEVGAGNGELAGILRRAGVELDAIDRSHAAVEEAEADGELVIEADWLHFSGGPYAAVLFTRSLHHIDPVLDAVAHAARLAPGGLLLGDDFAAEELDEAAAQLLGDARALLSVLGMTTAEVPFAVDPLAAWRYRTTVEHPIASGAELLAAVAQHAELVRLERVPFVARFVSQFLDRSDPRSAAVSAALLDIEVARIDAGRLPAIGFRFSARLH